MTLKRNGIKARSTKEASGGLTDLQEKEVCARYQEGETTTALASCFDVTGVTISAILKRNNIARRTPREAGGGLSDAQEASVCRQYLTGENTLELGEAYGVSGSTIGAILKRNGIERRAGNGGADSVQHVLDGTGRHATPRECEFYLFELARYSQTHCKPGIAFNADTRASCARAQGEYGAEALRLVLATRAEAYFLEQAVLDATRGCADCPDDLKEWIGTSEIRAMRADDMVTVVLRLAQELEDLGPWEFAASYVPMTATQRMECQRRGAAAISPMVATRSA